MGRIQRTPVASWLLLGCLALCSEASAQTPDNEQDDDGEQPIAAATTVPPRRGRERPARDHPEAQPLPRGERLPRPDQASGFAIAPAPAPRGVLSIPRAMLFLPRAAFEIINAPIRGGLWAYDRYDVGQRAVRLFFNDERTFGIHPVALFESGFGISLGARLSHHDLFGDGERLGLDARYGGRFGQGYGASLDTGDRFGPLRLEVMGEYERRAKERFFGIGNLDEVDLGDAIEPVDPYGDQGVAARYRERGARGGAAARYQLAQALDLELRGTADSREFSEASGTSDPDIDQVYDTAELIDFADGTDAWIGELRLSYDTRRSASKYVSESVPGRGWLLTGYGGFNAPITGDRDSFWRYGADAQLLLDLYHGTRVLGLRAIVDEVHADPEDVPFVYLPALGGVDLLRGYPSERFRDRALTMASAEYTWELTRTMFAFTFVDVGRVQPSLADASVDDVRLGYGGGLRFQTQRSFLMRVHIASSIDGGVSFNLAFDPAIDARVEEE